MNPRDIPENALMPASIDLKDLRDIFRLSNPSVESFEQRENDAYEEKFGTISIFRVGKFKKNIS